MLIHHAAHNSSTQRIQKERRKVLNMNEKRQTNIEQALGNAKTITRSKTKQRKKEENNLRE